MGAGSLSEDASSLPMSSSSQEDAGTGNEKLGTDLKSIGGRHSGGTGSSVAEEQLAIFEEQHQWDPNLAKEKRDEVHRALQTHDIEKEAALDISVIEEQSPYPEVNTSVRNTDEDVPVNTIRVWVLGMLLTTIGSGVNMLLSMHSPQIFITSIVVQIVVYPLGVFWAWSMPSRTFTTFGKKWSLNPGPFNTKEHTLIVVMANASFAGTQAYGTDTILAQQLHYGQNFGWGFSILLVLTTQLIGFGISGFTRRFLVWPAAMIWPANLVNTTLFYTLHEKTKTDPAKTNGWSISRYRFFLYVAIGSFIWNWFPGFIAQFLSTFAFITWIRPNSIVVNKLFGGFTGLSLVPLTFDWSVISGYLLSPLVPPWHASFNTAIGIFCFIVITIGMHFSGSFYAPWLPISDSSSYDNTQNTYNVTRILTPEFTFDVTKYEAYSPIFLSSTFILLYGFNFAAVSSVLVHTAIFHGKDIWKRAKGSRHQQDDIHMKLMRKYAEVPEWWYGSLFIIVFALSFVTCYVWDTHLTWWALIVGIVLSTVLAVPIGTIQAFTNIQIGLNVIAEFLIGYMLPGRPIAMMMFKTYGFITMTQALGFVSDLKLGHYMKVPPRLMFSGQVIATIWSCIVQVCVMNWAVGNIPNICTPEQADNFKCNNIKTYFNASILWGVIGPQRLFSPGQLYNSMLWFFLIGAAIPVIIYIAAKKWPNSKARFVMAPVIFGSMNALPPATPINFLTWSAVGLFFNGYIRNHFRGWWLQFNYILSAALDSGLAICLLVIFFGIYLSNSSAPNWWGNMGVFNTMDSDDTAISIVVDEGNTFGPSKW